MLQPPRSANRRLMRRMPSRLQVVVWLDFTLLISVCALEQVPFTGLIVHEWLGIALAGMIVAHLLLSWAWIASTTRRLIVGASGRTRINYILNTCLFGCMIAVILSGILISQQAIPALTRKEAEGTGRTCNGIICMISFRISLLSSPLFILRLTGTG